jgi:hypothetical protein
MYSVVLTNYVFTRCYVFVAWHLTFRETGMERIKKDD